MYKAKINFRNLRGLNLYLGNDKNLLIIHLFNSLKTIFEFQSKFLILKNILLSKSIETFFIKKRHIIRCSKNAFIFFVPFLSIKVFRFFIVHLKFKFERFFVFVNKSQELV